LTGFLHANEYPLCSKILQAAHPHPVLPCCLAFASATQQASTPDNAGPPQQLLASGHSRPIANAGLGQNQFHAFGGLMIAGDSAGDRADLSAQRWAQLA
jgi:hypothetical protein